MARVDWTAAARRDYASILDWYERNRDPGQAGRIAAAILTAIDQAASRPEVYTWVGSVHAELADQPDEVRRVLTHPPHHTVYYRYHARAERVEILRIRGAGQRPPTLDERG